MSINLSVIIPTHNPDEGNLSCVLESLKSQTLPLSHWEICIVDNASNDSGLIKSIDLSWHLNAKHVNEQSLGLAHARVRGIERTSGDLLLFVDDDNVLDTSYLSEVQRIFDAFPDVGAIGGKSLPRFECQPPRWIKDFYGCLALRDLGEKEILSATCKPDEKIMQYPPSAPIGAGMALRRQAVEDYVSRFKASPERFVLDRRGTSLSSGGDNDLVLSVIKGGWRVGYFPSLILQHIIPKDRITTDYLSRVSYASSKSWVSVLAQHSIFPWKPVRKWSVPFRKIRSYFRFQAWRNDACYIRWRGACGLFEGLGEITD